MSIEQTLKDLADKLTDAFGQHSQQLADRKAADRDLNVQMGQLTNAVHSYRRELREHIDKTELRWAALFEASGIEDPTRG